MTVQSGFFRSLAAAGALALTLSGCGENAVDEEGDTTPPAIASVTAVDASHIDVQFDEKVKPFGATHIPNYVVIEVPRALEFQSQQLDTLHLVSCVLHTDQQTVTLTTATTMKSLKYDLTVAWVSDLAGNNILTPVTKRFTGSDAADVTPPVLVYRSPGPDAVNVAVSMPVGLRFSEPVTHASLVSGTSWTADSGPVDFWVAIAAVVEVSLIQNQPLAEGTTYTVTLDGIEDTAGNAMATVSWSFTTAGTP